MVYNISCSVMCSAGYVFSGRDPADPKSPDQEIYMSEKDKIKLTEMASCSG